MVVLHFTPTQFFNYLDTEGGKKIADYPDEDIVVYQFQDQIVPVQIRKEYYPCYVVKICEALKIPVPADFKKVAQQLEKVRARMKAKSSQQK